jgi:hypothetical protein
VSPDFCLIDEDGLFKLIEKNKSFFLNQKYFKLLEGHYSKFKTK